MTATAASSGAQTGGHTYVGFGFGAIQAGLFLYEAQCSGAFSRLVVAEVLPQRVEAVSAAGGFFSLNIAHAGHIETAQVGPVEIYNPADPAGRARLIEAVAAAGEIGTAAPSVQQYAAGGPAAIAAVLAAGLAAKAAAGGPPAVVYAAENHNHAAELLAEAVHAASPTGQPVPPSLVCFANTVIGKMSGIAPSDSTLAPIATGLSEAFLVESFNRILISQISRGAGFARRLSLFIEKEELLPYEEAKLYIHNAVHATAAYLGAAAGVERMAYLPEQRGVLETARRAVVEEAGAGLLARYSGLDPLFTPTGLAAYADDLLARMTNPYLRDTTARVGRDPQRKLGWSDRLVGAMRLARAGGVEPQRLALGAGAALAFLPAAPLSPGGARELLLELWQAERPDPAEAAHLAAAIAAGYRRILAWQATGCPDLAHFAAA